MEKKIKVLMLVPNLNITNGVSSYVMNYLRKIDLKKIQMDFAIYNDSSSHYYKEIEMTGGKVFILPPVKQIWNHINKCEEILRQENYDIIHDNSLHITFPLMCIAKRVGVPVRILHSHNSSLRESFTKRVRNKLALPFLLMTANQYSACSEKAAKVMFGNRKYKFAIKIMKKT